MSRVFASKGIFFICTVGLLTWCGCNLFSNNRFHDVVKLGDGKEWRMYPVIVDADGDGKLDIVAAQRRPLHENSFHIWKGAGDGTFTDTKQTWNSPGYCGIGTGDLNGDKKPDFVMGSHYNRIHTFLSTDTFGKYKDMVLPTPDGYIVARIEDLNKDGQPEVIMLGNEKAGVEIFEFNDITGLSLKHRFLDKNIGRDMRIVDMNNDGMVDIVVSMGRIGVAILIQNAQGGWDQAAPPNFHSETKEFKTLDVADINGDGWQDILLNGGFEGLFAQNGPDAYISKGKDGGWTEVSSGFKVFKKPAEGLVATDFNGDGKLDVIAGGNQTDKLHNTAYGLFLFLGDGKGNWNLDTESGLPATGLPRNYGLTAQDLNNDGIKDLISIHGAPEEGNGFLGVWMGRRKN